MFENIKIAVIGCGYWGKNLVRNFHQLGVLKYIFDTDKNAAEQMCSQYTGLKIAASLDEIIADKSVTAIACATPAASHYQLAKRCLSSDKHIFMEKPLTLSVSQGEELVELARSRNLILMVDHILQSHPAYVKLKSLVKDQRLGKIRHIYSRRLSFGKIRSEENALWSFAPHDISMILGLTGQMPNQVAAWGGDWLNPGTEDMVEAHFDFPGGIKAKVSVSWLNPFKEHRLVVCGEKAMAVFDDTMDWPDKLKLYHHKVDFFLGKIEAKAGEVENIPLQAGEPLKIQCQCFLSAINHGETLVSDGAEGLRVLSVLEALSRSLKQQGLPIAMVKDLETDYFVHSSSIVDTNVSIGAGSKIWHFSHILSGSVIGENCNLGQNVVVGPNVRIGRGVKIQNNVSVYEGVTLEDDVFCGPSMVFTNVHNPRANIVRKDEYRETILKQGATVGANATIVCGNTLGCWCMVGAGAVVTRDVPDYALVLGNPARKVGWICRCGVRLGQDNKCKVCGCVYVEKDGKLEKLDGGPQ